LKGLVAAEARPQYLREVESIARKLDKPFLIQPFKSNANYNKFRLDLEKLEPDLIISSSYSMIIQDDVLEISKFGGLNIHFSFLPFFRGCHPTQYALIENSLFTGVTVHEISSGIDEGPIVCQQKVNIRFDDTWIDIDKRCEQITDKILKKNITKFLGGNWESKAQNEAYAKYYKRRYPEDGFFSWNESVIYIYNLNRGLVFPYPGTLFFDGTSKYFINSFKSIGQIASLKFKYRKVSYHHRKFYFQPLEKKDRMKLVQYLDSFGSRHNKIPMLQSAKMFLNSKSSIIFFIRNKKSNGIVGLILLSNISNLEEKIVVFQYISKKVARFRTDLRDISKFTRSFCTRELGINNLKFNHIDKKELLNVLLSNKKMII